MSTKIEVRTEIKVFDTLRDALPDTPPDRDNGDTYCIWQYGDKILCSTESQANALADMLDAVGYTAVTGYYDPDEDTESGLCDAATGWYYVDV